MYIYNAAPVLIPLRLSIKSETKRGVTIENVLD
jgi:hypothetical protein